jgi:hypothetical protein
MCRFNLSPIPAKRVRAWVEIGQMVQAGRAVNPDPKSGLSALLKLRQIAGEVQDAPRRRLN